MADGKHTFAQVDKFAQEVDVDMEAAVTEVTIAFGNAYAAEQADVLRRMFGHMSAARGKQGVEKQAERIGAALGDSELAEQTREVLRGILFDADTATTDELFSAIRGIIADARAYEGTRIAAKLECTAITTERIDALVKAFAPVSKLPKVKPARPLPADFIQCARIVVDAANESLANYTGFSYAHSVVLPKQSLLNLATSLRLLDAGTPQLTPNEKLAKQLQADVGVQRQLRSERDNALNALDLRRIERDEALAKVEALEKKIALMDKIDDLTEAVEADIKSAKQCAKCARLSKRDPGICPRGLLSKPRAAGLEAYRQRRETG
jgi:hypothetical protein